METRLNKIREEFPEIDSPRRLSVKDKLPNYSWVVNTKCEHFPCHTGIDQGQWSCLFCFCPWFWDCGIKNDGKECPDCSIPHDRTMYPVMMKGLKDIYRDVKSREDK